MAPKELNLFPPKVIEEDEDKKVEPQTENVEPLDVNQEEKKNNSSAAPVVTEENSTPINAETKTPTEEGDTTLNANNSTGDNPATTSQPMTYATIPINAPETKDRGEDLPLIFLENTGETEEETEDNNASTEGESSDVINPDTDNGDEVETGSEVKEENEEDAENDGDEGDGENANEGQSSLPLTNEDIPNDPDQWAQLMEKNPQLANSIYDYFLNLEDERKKDQKKEDREALGRAFSNMMRAFGNLAYAGKGGLNTYDSEAGQKNVDAVHERYEKARKARNDNYTQMWNFLQGIRNQNLKESAQKHKEEIDNINAQIKQKKADAENEINYWKTQYEQGRATYQQYKAEEQRIKAENAQELQDLEKERKKAQTSASNASAKKSVQQGNAAEKNAQSRETEAAAAARLRNDQADILENGGNVNLSGLYD